MTPKKIQNLNKDLRRAKKAKKKTAPPKPKTEAPAPTPEADYDALVRAIENSKQPIVNVQQREPVSYRITVDINGRGDMVGALMEPIK